MKLKKFEDLLKESWDDLDDIDFESQGKTYYGDEDEESLYDDEEYDDYDDDCIVIFVVVAVVFVGPCSFLHG